MVDRDSAERLGNRKLGELADMVSQFEVSRLHPDQLQGQARTRDVAGIRRLDQWLNNRKTACRAICRRMVSQAAEVVACRTASSTRHATLFPQPRASSALFLPDYMFDTPTFEIDDDGHPYWNLPEDRKDHRPLRGRISTGPCLWTPSRAKAPTMLTCRPGCDRVYSAELIIEQYDYHGQYVNGFFNSVFGQRDVTVTTDGYNNIALNDDVYIVHRHHVRRHDQSNVGFILPTSAPRRRNITPSQARR